MAGITVVRFQFSTAFSPIGLLDVSKHFRQYRFMEWTTEDWKRLGDEVRAARRQAGYRTAKDFADHLGDRMSSKTYYEIEAGNLGKRKRFSPDSMALLEEEFGWYPGAYKAILDNQAGLVMMSRRETWPTEPLPTTPEGRSIGQAYLEARAEIDSLYAEIEELDHALSAIKEGGIGDGDTLAKKRSERQQQAVRDLIQGLRQEMSELRAKIKAAALATDPSRDRPPGESEGDAP